jgi:hypothetical protein
MEYFDDIEWIEEKFGPMICNSGGADGSDMIYEEVCSKKGMQVVAWSFTNHKTKSQFRKILSKEELEEGFEHVKIANENLKRSVFSLKPYVKNLLSRDWFQVKNSDAIYAIGTFQKASPFTIVNGGTGWAVQMGIDNKKQVYVFDQDNHYPCWFIYDYSSGRFITNKDTDLIPSLKRKFAGIGTREINESGIKAIHKLFENIKT